MPDQVITVGPNRYQVWWESSLLGRQCDAYPDPGRAMSRLDEVEQREFFVQGVVIDMQEHLTSQEDFKTQQEFEQEHKQFTKEVFST